MQQLIDINLFKKNPQIFISQLPKNAEEEMVEFLNFLMFKYKINLDFPDKEPRFKNFIENPIKVEKKIKFTRDELHER